MARPPLKMRENALVVFFRLPPYGTVGATGGVDADTLLAVETGDDSPRGVVRLGHADFPCLPQRGPGLGERMHNAFGDVFSPGYRRVVLMDADIPDLPAPLIFPGSSLTPARNVRRNLPIAEVRPKRVAF